MKHVYVFIFLFISFQISAQIEIKGLVISEQQKTIFRANIVLLNTQNEIETFGFSNKDGSFSVSTSKVGSYVLQVSSMGFLQKKVNIEIKSTREGVDLGTLLLERDQVREIKEVTIKNPIRLKKDTVEYSAVKFSEGTEKNVEELLKKLPGIKIESDGKIKFNDKEISSVMIEGDDLFERGYQILTQNMPANPIDKIQVVTNFSKNKLLKNIQNTESVGLNITLKEDSKGKWFGNLMLASTSYEEGMRQGKLNLMNFSKRKKFYVLLNANNLGVNEMNGVQYLINPSTELSAENIGNVSSLSLINLHRKNFQFEEKRTNFNNDKLGSINYIYNTKNDWKLKLVGIFNEIENRNFVDSYYKFIDPQSSFTNKESNKWKLQNANIVGKLELSKDFKKNSNFLWYNKIASLKEDNDNLFIFNDTPNSQIGTNKLFSMEHTLVFTQKIDSSKAWVAVGRALYQNRPYEFWDQNNIAGLISGNNAAKTMHQKVDTRTFFGGAKFTFLKSYSEKSKFEIQVGNEFRNEFLNSELTIRNLDNQKLDFDNSEYINHLDYLLNDVFFNVKRTFSLKKWNFSAGVDQHFYSSKINSSDENNYTISPNLSVQYKYKHNGLVSLSGGRKLASIRMERLYTNYIYIGNRNFNRNAMGFQMLPDYNLILMFSHGNPLSQEIKASVFYTRTEKYVSNNVLINPNFTMNQNILIQNNSSFNFTSEIKRYLKFIRSRISIFNNYMTSNYENSVNSGPLRQTDFSSYKLGIEMKSGWIRKINYEFGYEWNFNSMKSNDFSNSYVDQRGFVNLYYNFSKVLKASSSIDYYKFGNTEQKSTQFWDVQIDYRLPKNKVNFFVKGNNLLNSNSIQRYSLTNISESLYTQRLLPRNVVLGMDLSF